MNQQTKTGSRNYDTPIPKPPDEVFERFIRSTEARLVTRRFNTERNQRYSEKSKRIEAR